MSEGGNFLIFRAKDSKPLCIYQKPQVRIRPDHQSVLFHSLNSLHAKLLLSEGQCSRSSIAKLSTSNAICIRC